MKQLWKVLTIVLVLFILAGCAPAANNATQADATAKEAEAVGNQQKIYMENQPAPQFDFSLERDIFIQLYQLRNEAASTYTVVVDSYGNPVFQCPSVGYPLAADVQLTNPITYINDPNGGYHTWNGSILLPQAEPNGLFSSTNTVGTWVMCTQDDGTVYPYYSEMNAQTWPFPVKRTWVAMDDQHGYFIYVPADGAHASKTIKIKTK